MILKELLHAVPVIQVEGSLEVEIASVCFDSREVKDGALFVAVRGVHADGHLFVDKVAAAGAAAIVVEELPAEMLEGVTYLLVNDSAYVLGLIAGNFYGNPSKDLK